MSESNLHSRIAGYIHDIIEACRQDPSRLEVATTNFQSLVNAMKLYERAPRYFNMILEDAEAPHNAAGQEKRSNEADMYKFPVVGELEKIYGKKLKQTELQMLGNALANKVGLRLDRDTKRSKVLLLQWFSQNWTTIHPKIYEHNLNKMSFTK